MADLAGTIAVKLQTPVPRLWTPYPGPPNRPDLSGITIGADTYAHVADLEVGQIVETADGSSTLACTLRIANADTTASDLVLDAANVGAAITITRVEFDASWNVAATVVWFEGRTGEVRFAGDHVEIQCEAYLGRVGSSPQLEWSAVLVNHTPPPEGSKILWPSTK